MKKGEITAIIGILIVIVVIVIIVVSVNSNSSNSEDLNEQEEGVRVDIIDSEMNPNNSQEIFEGQQAMDHTIEMSTSGFSPSSLSVSQGDTVLFLAIDGGRWPASDIHPSHRSYPGSSINKCNTVNEGEIFDACGAISKGQSYSFTFNEVGTWRYHDHLNPSKGGTIIVS